MPEMYAVTATRNGCQIPTFYLIANVQGIVGEAHAANIAAKVLHPDFDHCIQVTAVSFPEAVARHV
ncbi:MAG: hypothetical protein ACJ780_10295 [Solirubrobacteraceae bacterium]|jgi:hypothetical protein